MSRFWWLTTAWVALLVVGFALVFTLGRPIPLAADELAAAMHPVPPVTEAAAITSSNTIIRIQYPNFEGIEPVIERRTDYGIDHWLVTYSASDGSAPNGVIASIGVDTGIVEIATFP